MEEFEQREPKYNEPVPEVFDDESINWDLTSIDEQMTESSVGYGYDAAIAAAQAFLSTGLTPEQIDGIEYYYDMKHEEFDEHSSKDEK